jgi:4-hydroxy-tetrahydrodipicolinate synthase
MTDFEALRNKLKGPIFSIITPFKNNGQDVDYESLENYIKFMYKGGARIFYAMAFNTRYLIMSEDEILRVNSVVIETVKKLNDPDTVIIVGDPLNCSTETSIKFARHALEAGADIISLIFRAYYFFDDQVYNHYKAVADAVPDIGILVHEMPFMKGVPQKQDGSWPLSLLDRLADITSIVAMKEDAKDDDYTRQVVDKISDRVAIIVSGNGLQQWCKVADSCQAWLTGVSNFVPKAELDFYEAFLNGDKAECQHIIDHVEKPFFWLKDNYGWHTSIKSALDILGVMSREERMPYQILPAEQHETVRTILEKISTHSKYLKREVSLRVDL